MSLFVKRRDLGWTPYAWLIYVAFFYLKPIYAAHITPLEWTLTIAATIVFLFLYIVGYQLPEERLFWVIVPIALIGAAFYPWNMGAGCFFIYAAAFAGMKPSRTAVITIGAIELLVIAESLIFHVPMVGAFWPIFFSAVIGGTNMHFAQVHRTNKKLRMAQDEIEHLAKVAERERIARDLHDLLGHTLSLIILKSELASKLAERDVDRARAEIRDVERISRDALAQVRSAVRGYRSGGIAAELEAAKQTLDAAGVALEKDIEPVAIPASHEAVLALALCEAVTNVVRHARATRCRIALRAEGTGVTLTIADDGRGGEAPFGSGLAGMRERIAAHGGTLVRDGAQGTTLTIAMPLPPNVTAIGERSA